MNVQFIKAGNVIVVTIAHVLAIKLSKWKRMRLIFLEMFRLRFLKKWACLDHTAM